MDLDLCCGLQLVMLGANNASLILPRLVAQSWILPSNPSTIDLGLEINQTKAANT
jgi:hypothetical protein